MELPAVIRKTSSSSLLAPGFRFHPTDEELVRYYLRRKVCGKGFRFDAISDIDIYKAEPWDLPSLSKLRTRDLEWYFFSVLDKKYANGAKTNRTTEKGYWKTTGKDRAVYHKSQIVGMKKTLVYHIGRAPKGQRTNWVMHEYKLTDLELERAGVGQDAFVLCRIFQKSGSGPKNGERYGAPFMEEEWEDDELEFVRKAEAAEEVHFNDDVLLNDDELQQILGSSDVPSDVSPQMDPNGKLDEQTAESINDSPKPLLTIASEQYCEFEQQYEDENFYDPDASTQMDVSAVKHEYIEKSSVFKGLSDELDYLLDEPFVDALDGIPHGNERFLQANDLTNPDDSGTSAFDMLDEYLMFFDANDNNIGQFAFDPSSIPGTEDLVSDQALIPTEDPNDGTEQSNMQKGQHVTDDNGTELSGKLDSAQYDSDIKYPFFKKASHMLGSISAPPAIAAEFPSKEAMLRLDSLSQPSTSVHVTAGVIQIRNLNTDGNTKSHQNFNVVVSFGFSQRDDGSASLESSLSVLRGKTAIAISRGLLYSVLVWAVILSVGFKMGACICAK